MGMCPELPIAMLACARIGAPHTVVFGGFSANAWSTASTMRRPSLVITQDGAYRRGNEVKLKHAVDEALTLLTVGEERGGLPAHRHAADPCTAAAITGGTS